MAKNEVIEMLDFEYSPQGFCELQSILKSGKIVRNPFAKFCSEDIEITTLPNTVDLAVLVKNSQ